MGRRMGIKDLPMGGYAELEAYHVSKGEKDLSSDCAQKGKSCH